LQPLASDHDGADAGLRVRPLREADVEAFLGLIDALADYEHLTPPDAAARARLARDGLGASRRFTALIAERAERAVGYAVFFETYSTFLALPTLYLEDIFVLPSERGRGIGRALFSTCAGEAARRGCGRMEWQVLDWNDLALGFYEHLGAQPLHADWRCYRLEGSALAEAARSED
jgi:GNAT superfamily N-acetyltransferase